MNETWDRKSTASSPESMPEHADRDQATGREWQLIEKVVLTHSDELRRTRRWGILFKSLTFIYLFALFYFIFLANDTGGPVVTGGHVAVIEVHGQIGDNLDVSMESVRQPLISAFAHDDTKAVVLDINSPGGSPVQSQMIYDHIRLLKTQYPDIPVYAVIGELGASGGYYIAAAADEIYASGTSLVGSIGVVSGSFGFTEAMERLGIERRLYTAGESKGFLDVFSPENGDEIEHWQTVLDSVQNQFIADVRAGRGERLLNDTVFTGLIWSGSQAMENGLTDGIDTVYSLAERLDIDELLHFEPDRDPWRQLLDDFGLAVGRGAVSVLTSEHLPSLR
ncbi:MAG: S49 family peptidase [Natronospirillum sp.]